MKFSFNSVVFSTQRLAELRAFYEGVLGLPTGTYEKDGRREPDFSDSYVNYHIFGGLLGFEVDGGGGGGDIILNVDMDTFRERVRNAGIAIVRETSDFFMIKDPEDRTVIFERPRSPDPTLYAIHLHKIEGRNTNSPIIAAHVDHLRRLNGDGHLVLCGPCTDHPSGLIIVRAIDKDEAIVLAKRDPFVSEGYRTFEVRSWLMANENNNYLG